MAGTGHLAAAILLPLYYCRRRQPTSRCCAGLRAGESVWQAHRTHFYQRATDNGFTVTGGDAQVFAVNIALAALALICVRLNTPLAEIACLAAGTLLVGLLLMRFSRRRG